MSIHTYIHACMHTYTHVYTYKQTQGRGCCYKCYGFLTVPLFYSTDLLTYSNTMSVIPVPLSHLISSALMAIT